MRPQYIRGRVRIKRTEDEERGSMRTEKGTEMGWPRFFSGRPSWGCMEYIPSGTPRPLICKFICIYKRSML